MLVLFVGNNDDELATVARSYDASAYLIDSSNYLNKHQGTAYTSIADLPDTKALTVVFEKAGKIIYHQPTGKWSDSASNKNKRYSGKWWIEYYLNIFALADKSKQFVNLPKLYNTDDRDIMLDLVDVRKIKEPQMWAVGCSFTTAIGVDVGQRYCDHLAKELNLSLSILAVNGSSLSWAADQIIRSDIKPGDTVIWGLTEHRRISYYDQQQQKILHILSRYYEIDPGFDKIIRLDFLEDPTLIYSAVIAINQVINFCRKLNVKLVLAGFLTELDLAVYLKDLPEYLQLTGIYGGSNERFLDLGTDNAHPGPLTHRWYADKIITKLKELN